MLWTPDSNAYEALGYRLTFIRSEVSATDLAVSSQMAGKSHETEIKRTAAACPKGGGRRRLGLSIFVNFVSITLKKKSQLFDNHLTAKKIFDIVEYSTGPEYSIKKKVTRFWAENTKKSQF